MVAVDAAHLARPRIADDQVALGGTVLDLAIGIDQRRLHAEEGQGGRTRFQIHRTGQRRDQDAAGLGLPPGIDDRATAVADHFVVPAPGFRIDRFADAAKQAQRSARGLLHRLLAFAHQRTDGGGGGVEDRHLVLVDHVPEARGIGVVRYALEHQRGRAIGQRAVHDVAVAGDPADVGGAPVDVVLAQVEHRFMGVGRVQQVAAGGVQHALRLAGGTGGVEDEQRILGVHRFRFAAGRLAVDHVMEPAVARGLHVHRAAGVAHHQHGFHGIGAGQLQRRIDVGLQRNLPAATQAFVGGDDQLALAIADTVGDRVRREATEHHRVDRTDARAGQHGHGSVDDHRQVDGDPVALLDAQVAQRVAETAGALVQLAIGHVLGRRIRAVRLEQQGGLVATLFQLTVQAVHAGVELAIFEPLDVEVGQVVADVLDLRRLARPVQPLGGLAPERIRIGHRGLVLLFIGILVDTRLGGELRIDGVEISHGTLTCTLTLCVQPQHCSSRSPSVCPIHPRSRHHFG
ncbi:hypothetical protein D3C72_1066480 [compost metagenome]